LRGSRVGRSAFETFAFMDAVLGQIWLSVDERFLTSIKRRLENRAS
jgi:hypothetical protein